jgi:predicted membrane GTPase involved in stress response
MKPNQPVKVLANDGKLIEQGRVSKILAFRGLERQPVDEARRATSSPSPACPRARSPTRSAIPRSTEPLPAQPIDPPTVTMTFIVNDSPLAGTEGDKVTSRVIRDRLLQGGRGQRRAEDRGIADKDSLFVSGRGELQLAILIETMRREGLRARRVAPARRHAEGRERRDCSSRSRKSSSTSTRSIPASSCRRCRAQGRDGRDAPLGRRPPAPRLPRADARPDRLPGRAC